MPQDQLVHLGGRIKRLRKQLGWTRAVMAERVGIDRSFLAYVERGKRNVSVLTLFHISQGLGITLAQLFSRLWVLYQRGATRGAALV